MHGIGIAIDRDSGQSLTDQLVDGLRSAIRLGRWKGGDRIPTRAELMAKCGVSRNVVQSAIRRLVAEGLVVTRPRLGCTVARSSRRSMRGVVLEVDTGCGIPYWNASFSESLRRALSAERIDCRNIGLSYDSNDKLSGFDRERLEYELAQHPDLVVVVSSMVRSAELQKILDAHDVPYVVRGSPTHGKHPRMLWSRMDSEAVRFGEFVADCVRAGIRSVTWLAYSEKAGFDPRSELEKKGIAVETLLTYKKSLGYDIELGCYMALARDCMMERMKKGGLCDLLFIADDYIAMGAIPVLLENGVRIPKDLKLVTQYNKGFGPVLTKSLARIEVDPERFGMECARGIVEYFKTDKSPELDFPEPVYIRGETFPVPD
ncbi:MAG: GntR family transcriptional regulator [Kiritimatiellae bacterium]|nr:GntR family transcriptional regulator [Kiritimatiellia bacterium]